MLYLAVCDDQKSMAEYISARITKACQECGEPADVEWYTDALTLEKEIADGRRFDALLLDIDMPGLNGIEFCRRLRARSLDTLVVFISNKEELVFQTFAVSPFRFIRKAHFAEELHDLSRDLIGEINRRKPLYLRFQDERKVTVYSVNIRSLIYAEAMRKECRLVSLSEEMNVRIQFSELTDKLLPYDFILIHRSFLVNPRYIFRIDMNEVLLDGGKALPMSRNRRSEVRDSFFRWQRSSL